MVWLDPKLYPIYIEKENEIVDVMKSKQTTLIMTGGIGRHVAFSAVIPKVVEEYGEVDILSAFPDLYEGIDGVRRSINMNVEYGYDDYFKGRNRFAPEPYEMNDFFNKKIGIIEGFMKSLNLEYDEEEDLPIAIEAPQHIKAELDKRIAGRKYIAVQFVGGNQAQNQQPNQKNMVKDYPMENLNELLTLFSQKYKNYAIVNVGLSYEYKIPGSIEVSDLPYTAMPYVLQKAETFIAIDSSLQHFSAARNIKKKGIVLWGATSPVNFGYKQNINLTNSCPFHDLHCSRPYFRHSSDFVSKGNVWTCKKPECIKVTPKFIMDNLDVILGGK